jgi:hypothetical protein
MGFFRIFQHLLPTGAAWRTTTSKALRRLLQGLAGAPEDARDFVDAVHADIFPDTTTQLAEWEAQFGLAPAADDASRRLALAAEWAATGGQSPRYIQDVLQTAGFPVYVHEWWSSGPPYVARDPHAYTLVPLIGSVQCTATGIAGQPQCGDGSVDVDTAVNQYQCDRFLMNDPHYIVNENLTDVAPPPIPSDPNTWRYFIYIGASNFPDHIAIPAARRAEFKRLILKLRPLQNWIVTLIDFDSGDGLMGTEKVSYRASAAVSITLASLASDTNLLQGRASAVIDNTTNLDEDIILSGAIYTGTSPTTGKTIEVWAIPMLDDSTWPDTFGGIDAGVTATSRALLAAYGKPVIVFDTVATSNQQYPFWRSAAEVFGTEVPAKFQLFVVHNTGVNLKSSSQVLTAKGICRTIT